MRLSTKKALSSMVGVSAVLVALPVVAAGTAHATGEQCGSAPVEYSLDGGKTWTTKGRMDEALVTKIKVRLKDKPHNTCEYAVSLASYSAEGPTWASSGKQAFLGWDTTKLSKEKREATLDVSGTAPKCFGQVDLYGNGKKYDGSQFPLPHHPDAKFPTDLITAWNGGQKCDIPTPTTPPPATTSPSASPSLPTTKPTESSPAPTSAKPSGSPSTSPSPTSPKPSTTTTAPAPAPGDDTPPQGKPDVPPLTVTAPAALAETGGDDNTAVIIGASAGALLVGGAGVLLWNRRRGNGATPA